MRCHPPNKTRRFEAWDLVYFVTMAEKCFLLSLSSNTQDQDFLCLKVVASRYGYQNMGDVIVSNLLTVYPVLA